MIRLRLSVAALLVAIGGLAYAGGEVQENYGGSVNSGRLDVDGASARDQALGNAVAAGARGPAAFLANPALLMQTQEAYSLDYANPTVLAQRSLLAASGDFGAWGGLGAALAFADFGTVQGIDSELGTYSFNPSQTGLDLGWGRALGGSVSLGASFGALFQDFHGFGNKMGVGMAGGAHWHRNGLSLGWVHRMDSDLDRSVNTLLSSSRYGALYRLPWLESQESALSLQLDTDYQHDRTLRVGFENRSFGWFDLRGGYVAPMGLPDAVASWSAGLGARYDQLLIDFTFTGQGVLGDQRRVSLTWMPGKPVQPDADK